MNEFLRPCPVVLGQEFVLECGAVRMMSTSTTSSFNTFIFNLKDFNDRVCNENGLLVSYHAERMFNDFSPEQRIEELSQILFMLKARIGHSTTTRRQKQYPSWGWFKPFVRKFFNAVAFDEVQKLYEIKTADYLEDGDIRISNLRTTFFDELKKHPRNENVFVEGRTVRDVRAEREVLTNKVVQLQVADDVLIRFLGYLSNTTRSDYELVARERRLDIVMLLAKALDSLYLEKRKEVLSSMICGDLST